MCRKVPGQAPDVRPSVLSREGTASPASLCFPKEGPGVREVKALTKVIQQKRGRENLTSGLPPGHRIPGTKLPSTQTHTTIVGPGEASSCPVAPGSFPPCSPVRPQALGKYCPCSDLQVGRAPLPAHLSRICPATSHSQGDQQLPQAPRPRNSRAADSLQTAAGGAWGQCRGSDHDFGGVGVGPTKTATLIVTIPTLTTKVPATPNIPGRSTLRALQTP